MVPDVPSLADAVVAIGQGGVDAVLLATSADARPALIRAALSQGLHVLAEKPLAGTVGSNSQDLWMACHAAF